MRGPIESVGLSSMLTQIIMHLNVDGIYPHIQAGKKSLIYYNKTLLSQTPMRNRNFRVPDTQSEIWIFPHTAAVVQDKG